MSALTDFYAKATERPYEMIDLKKQGKKLVGYIGNFIPPEMIYAAGAIAYPMCRGGEPEPPEAVYDEVLRYMNPLYRSIAGNIKLKLDPVAEHLDLIAASQNDCHVGRLAEQLEFMELPVTKVGVPSDWEREFNQEYYFNELQELKDVLEKLTGNPITDEALRKYSRLTNQTNEWLRKISLLRTKKDPPIGSYDFMRIAHGAMVVDPEETVAALEKIYEELKDAPGKNKGDQPRVLIFGHAIAMGDYVVLRKIEELGCTIVNEYMDEAIPWYQWDITEGGDPMRAIWRRNYLDKPPVDSMQPAWRLRMDYAMDLIREYQADGVIWYNLLYDEIYDLEFSCVSKWLNDENIPLMRIETSYEYTREAMLPLNTRIESFIEALNIRKGGC